MPDSTNLTDEQLRARFVTEIKKRNLFKNDVSEEWISANKDLACQRCIEKGAECAPEEPGIRCGSCRKRNLKCSRTFDEKRWRIQKIYGLTDEDFDALLDFHLELRSEVVYEQCEKKIGMPSTRVTTTIIPGTVQARITTSARKPKFRNEYAKFTLARKPQRPIVNLKLRPIASTTSVPNVSSENSQTSVATATEDSEVRSMEEHNLQLEEELEEANMETELLRERVLELEQQSEADTKMALAEYLRATLLSQQVEKYLLDYDQRKVSSRQLAETFLFHSTQLKEDVEKRRERLDLDNMGIEEIMNMMSGKRPLNVHRTPDTYSDVENEEDAAERCGPPYKRLKKLDGSSSSHSQGQ